MIRLPAVAGRFYPADVAELTQQIETLAEAGAPTEKLRARGCLVPHAGYQYSGHVAVAVYRRMELPSCYVIISPRHYQQGEEMAIHSEGAWQTPRGEVGIDRAFGD